jgi:hypothetical protein
MTDETETLVRSYVPKPMTKYPLNYPVVEAYPQEGVTANVPHGDYYLYSAVTIHTGQIDYILIDVNTREMIAANSNQVRIVIK